MGRITLQQAALWCGGEIDPKYGDVTFLGANMDTRKLEAGQLFVALQGARDGHDFIDVAFEKGASAVLCTHCDGDYPAIVVPDTRRALGEIAKQERARLGMKVVGITGSVGKTTTKEMVATVLAQSYRVEKSPVNHNNDIGMSMAILSMQEGTEIAVLEMGMNQFREIARLSEIAKPDVAVIVNIGTMHIENLGSVQGILQAKLEILEGMDPTGKVVLNGDDSMLWGLHTTMPEVTFFGAKNPECGVFATGIRAGNEEIHFDVNYKDGQFSVVLHQEGMHYVTDALAAVSVGLQLNVEPEKISKALLNFQNADGRQEIFNINGYTIIKDCYNAGPESMAAALAVLHGRSGRRVAVLGDMLELGSCAQAEHYKVGRLAAENADLLFSYGPNSGKMLKGAVTGGMPVENVRVFDDREKMADALTRICRPGDVILVKGSRGMRMELVLERFLDNIRTTEDKK